MEMPDLVDVMTTPTCCISIRIRLKRSGFEVLYRANSCMRHLKNHPIAITLITASISTPPLAGFLKPTAPGPILGGKDGLRLPGLSDYVSQLRCRAVPPPRCVAALCRHRAVM